MKRPSFLSRLKRPAMPPWSTLVVLTLAVVGSVIHQLGPIFKWNGWMLAWPKLNLWEWYIEDAAITFAYSLHWYEGHGLVPFPGGERVEGYSNPLWMALMTLWYFVGVDGFQSSKGMALVFGGVTIILSWLIAREVADDRDSPATLIAPVVLAAFPQFAFWNASGLENSLFNILLAGGMLSTLVEARRGGFPWSSLWFLGLALTRPEGIMYGAWAGFAYLVWQVTQGRGLRTTLYWLLLFFVPFATYQVIRYEYFAWAFPNTYYAKLGDKEFRPFAWTSRGWKYIRGWASGTFDEAGHEGTGMGWFVPVFYAGLLGLRGTRALLVPVLALITAAFFLYPSSELTNTWEWWPKDLPEPDWWKDFRVWGIFALVFALPVARLGEPRMGGRIFVWGMGVVTLFFCIASSGDWMRGYRWMNFLAVPMAVIFALGVEEVAGAAQRLFDPGSRRWSTPAWVVAPLLTLAVMPSFYFHSEWFFGKRETGPFSVQNRANYTMSVAKKLFLDDVQIYNLDVDMGAHTYWSNHYMVDMAGLVDVSVAHHNFNQRSVTKEYIFDEMNPEIAHVHGGWAQSSKIPTFPEWKQNYFEIMPFPTSTSSKTYHVGTHIRRDLVMLPSWTGPVERRVEYEDGLILAGWRVPSPEVSRGKAFYVEIGVQYNKAEDRQDFRVLGFLSDDTGKLHVFDLPPVYDWLPPAEWRPSEVFFGKYAIGLPESLEPGSYDLGFVMVAADGRPLQIVNVAGGQEPLPGGVTIGGRGGVTPRFVAGEVRFSEVLMVGDAGTSEKAAREDFVRAVDMAEKLKCRDAEEAWRLARMHLPKATNWQDQNRTEIAPTLGDCWVRAAEHADSAEEAADMLERARFWDLRNDQLWDTAARVGEDLYKRAMVARDAQDWEVAYDLFSAAVRANPIMSWARRYAEEARDYRLKIDPESVEKAKADREAAREAKPTPAPKPATPPKPPAPPRPEGPTKADAPQGKPEAEKPDAVRPKAIARPPAAEPKNGAEGAEP